MRPSFLIASRFLSSILLFSLSIWPIVLSRSALLTTRTWTFLMGGISFSLLGASSYRLIKGGTNEDDISVLGRMGILFSHASSGLSLYLAVMYLIYSIQYHGRLVLPALTLIPLLLLAVELALGARYNYNLRDSWLPAAIRLLQLSGYLIYKKFSDSTYYVDKRGEYAGILLGKLLLCVVCGVAVVFLKRLPNFLFQRKIAMKPSKSSEDLG